MIWEIEDIAYRCIVYTHYFQLVTENTEKHFWNAVQNALGDNVIIYWCHLFGLRGEDLHYSKFFDRPDVYSVGDEFKKEAIKQRILTSIGFDNARYKSFWEEVTNCRNTYLGHREIGAKGVYPDIGICEKMATELRAIIGDLVDKCTDNSPFNEELHYLYIHFCFRGKLINLSQDSIIMYNLRNKHSRDVVDSNY